MKNKLKQFFNVFGPGFITSKADNDAGAITSYIQAGALFGPWISLVMIILLPITYFCQIAAAKLAIVSNEGLISLIKRHLGIAWAKLTVLNLSIINFLTLITEFAAITQLCHILNINPIIAVPISIAALCLIVAPSNYRKWEKIMIFLCLLDLFWIILAMMSIPNIHMYHYSKVNMFSNDYLMMTMALIGTTIAPWQLFFQNSCVLDKKLTLKDYNHIKMETFIGVIFIVITAICMILIGCLNSGVFTNVPDFVKNIFTNNHSIINFILDVLILNASIIGTAAVSLSTAWVYAENKQINKSLNQKFSEAKPFYIHYYGSIVLAGLIALLPCISLNAIIIGVQIIACIFLPYQLIVIQILSNNKKLMKDQVNTKFTNVIMNSIISIIVILSVFLLCQSLHFL